MKYILLIFITAYSILLLGQEPTPENEPKHIQRFRIGFNFSPDIIYRSLFDKNNNLTRNEQTLNGAPILSFSTGINVQYQFSNRFSLEMGGRYSKKGLSTKEFNIISDSLILLKGPVGKLKYEYIYHYIDIPVRAIAIFGKKKIKFITSLGITTSILTREEEKAIFTFSDNGNDKSSLFRSPTGNRLNISSTISAGISYDFHKKHRISFEPTFHHQLINNTGLINDRLWSVGINFTYYYQLK